MATTRVSESITENIFREKYKYEKFIEKSAISDEFGFLSKNETGKKGYPDFFLDKNDYVIVVEAKATSHKDAINQIKFYMENNNIKYKDIIGIAITGQSEKDIQINYFLKIQGGDIQEIGDKNNFLSLHNIDKLYRKIKFGEILTNEALTKFLKSLNETLHKNKIVRDTERSLFFSGLLIALTDNNFRNTYHYFADTKSLNENILSAIDTQLQSKINNLSKDIGWKDRFSFIKTIDKEIKGYKKIISDIEKNIFIPFKNEEKLDILGKAYKIFLSRAGKITNKNIILTPDHIKSLMVKLADLNLDDVVIDTCTGSGGFLMDAMEKIIELSNGNDEKINNIKEHQLIGFEIDPVLFSLTCSNMFLHGDGRTNLIYRSSLLDDTETDNKVLEYIHTLKPTKCIINPPYENNGAFDFTWQAIDFLENNGKLVIIMPSNTLEKNMNKYGIKNTENLLKKCQLEAIIKMPENLFREQARTIQTSIFIFTKTPHNKSKNVLFYHLKDDGLVSVEHKGRVDIYNRWNDIEKEITEFITNLTDIQKKTHKQKIFDEKGNIVFEKENDDEELIPISDLFNVEIDPLKLQSTKNIEGLYSFITGSAEWKTHNQYSYDCEALVYCIGAEGSLGRCHYVNGKFTASSLCVVLTPKNVNEYPINLKYYKIYFDSIRDILVEALKSGASKKTISKTKLENYKIKYVPIDKQNKYFEEINNLQKKIDKIEKQKRDIYNNINDLIQKSLI